MPQPAFVGRRVVDDIGLDEIAKYIDWTFFFAAWELKGKYPKILDHPTYGEAARELFEHGQELLRRIIDEKLLVPRGVYGFWPAASDGDDIVLYADESREPRSCCASTCCASRAAARGQAEPLAGGLRRAERERAAGPPGRLRRHRGNRRRRARRGVRAGPRRLRRHHGEGPGRSPGRGLRRVPARASAARLGLRRGRDA